MSLPSITANERPMANWVMVLRFRDWIYIGSFLLRWSPWPSWPRLFWPQEYTLPSLSRAKAAVICWNLPSLQSMKSIWSIYSLYWLSKTPKSPSPQTRIWWSAVSAAEKPPATTFVTYALAKASILTGQKKLLWHALPCLPKPSWWLAFSPAP